MEFNYSIYIEQAPWCNWVDGTWWFEYRVACTLALLNSRCDDIKHHNTHHNNTTQHNNVTHTFLILITVIKLTNIEHIHGHQQRKGWAGRLWNRWRCPGFRSRQTRCGWFVQVGKRGLIESPRKCLWCYNLELVIFSTGTPVSIPKMGSLFLFWTPYVLEISYLYIYFFSFIPKLKT